MTDDEQLTDEDVARILRVLPQLDGYSEPAYGVVLGRIGDGPDTLDTFDIHKLVAEVRRLRGDDWLQGAAEEIDTAYASGGDPPRATVLTILRKHRDGT